ncbi:MAG: hypothetical protein ACMXYG_04120 [Candidatus Woesearchaeota archaeon]
MTNKKWNAELEHFTYKNPVISICLFALTLMVTTILVSYIIFSNNNYSTAQVILKIGGYLGAVLLLIGWKKSYDITKGKTDTIKTMYSISNHILLILTIVIIIAITAI